MVKNPVDVCDTSLVLGLGYPQRRAPPSDHHRLGNPSPLEPSLTLGHPDDAYGSRKLTHDAQLARQQSSSLTTVSSFSKPVSEEAERASLRASDEEEEGSARKKLRLSKEQSAFLEERFKEHSTLNPKQKQGLANQLNLRPRQIEVWFQNRRARTKMKQNEVEVELLRRYWETLTDENRRLKKELQELKGLKLAASPWFMQLPGATLAVCPTCERASGASDDSKAGTGKPQLFNPFTHSAAC